MKVPFTPSHSLTDLSKEALTIHLPSGENWTCRACELRKLFAAVQYHNIKTTSDNILRVLLEKGFMSSNLPLSARIVQQVSCC